VVASNTWRIGGALAVAGSKTKLDGPITDTQLRQSISSPQC